MFNYSKVLPQYTFHQESSKLAVKIFAEITAAKENWIKSCLFPHFNPELEKFAHSTPEMKQKLIEIFRKHKVRIIEQQTLEGDYSCKVMKGDEQLGTTFKYPRLTNYEQ